MSHTDTVIRVRMYRVGFGDCFLLSFPQGRHVLVDCGSYAERVDLRPVVEDIIKVTGNHIHLVIATHRHGDHINGFATQAELFNQIHVDEVWLPWTENPNDPVALELRGVQDKIAGRLRENAKGSQIELMDNNLSNRHALDVLIDGFAGNPQRRFIKAETDWSRSTVLPGARVLMLGPTQSKDVITNSTVGAYIAQSTVEAKLQRSEPFGENWCIDAPTARKLFRTELKERELLSDDSDQAYADVHYWLDKCINNTSLVLLIQYGRAGLLLPGDAQGEAWTPLLDRPDLAGSLQGLDFYKVSHHGSLTGNPDRVCEHFEHVCSMVSTETDNWPEIPKRQLLKRLAERGFVIRSDRQRSKDAMKQSKLWTEIELTP